MAKTLPSWLHLAVNGLILVTTIGSRARAESEEHHWTRSAEFDETSFTETTSSKIRIHVNAPLDENGKPARATRMIVYALPAGNTIEQSLGCRMKPGLDWHYDIQHVAAQVRLLRSLTPGERIVLVCPEGPGLSWSAFRKAHTDADARMAQLVDQWRKEFGATDAHVILTGHSNGGSFIFGVIDGSDEIPAYIDRVAFLDANYNFQPAEHASKFKHWLQTDAERRLVVLAYDDREIMLNGKKVLKPGAGTLNATKRMHDAFEKPFSLVDTSNPPFQESIGLDGRVHFFVHLNPQNKILHTVLVGEMNGLVHGATLGTPNEEKWGKFGGPRAYTRWVQAEPTAVVKQASENSQPQKANFTAAPANDHRLAIRRQSQIPARPKGAVSGSQFIKSLQGLTLDQREAAILREITNGNFPSFLRDFKTVPITGTTNGSAKEVSAAIDVMPDYLAVGSKSDFVRIPMTPQTAQQIADRFGCTMPTRKMVDAIDRVAEVRLAPHPMTADREAITTFAEHNAIVEKQRGDKPLGLLVIGSKKDIVLTPRIFEKPQRLAIYGWRQLNGQPIQPLTIVHWNRYVDYSHGVRLIRDSMELDGKSVKISELLVDPERCGLVSDEGPMSPPRYPAK